MAHNNWANVWPLQGARGNAAAPSSGARGDAGRTLDADTQNRPSGATATEGFASAQVSPEGALAGILADVQLRAGLSVLTAAERDDTAAFAHRVVEMLRGEVLCILLDDPQTGFQDFLIFACEALGLASARATAAPRRDDWFDIFIDFLAAKSVQAQPVAIVVDAAEKMSEELLAELVLIAKWPNLGKGVLQIILIGHPDVEAIVQKLVARELIAQGYRAHRLDSPAVQERALENPRLPALGEAERILAQLPTAEAKAGAASGKLLVLVQPHGPRAEGSLRRPPPLADGLQIGVQPEAMASIEAPARAARPPATLGAANRAEPNHASNPTAVAKESDMSRFESLTKILKSLQSESPGIEASALISEDGLMIASALSPDLDDTRVGGMTATLLSLGTRAATELRRGEVREVIVRGEEGYAVMVSAGRGALVLVLANENSKLGLIFFDVREAIKSINKVL